MEQDLVDIRNVLRGDRSSFARLVERYQNYVYTIAFRILKDREEAEETAQDTFVKVYKTLSSFKQDAKFSTWLYMVAYRTAIDRSRKKKRQVQSIDKADNILQIEDESISPLEQVEGQNLQEVLGQVVKQLPSIDGTMITLYYQGGKSVKEIAKILALSESNVKVKLYRIREVLKKKLSRYLRAEIKDLL